MTFLEQILLTVLTAFTTAILAYFGLWRQASAELKKEYGSRFNEKKWEAYSSFVKLVPILVEINRILEIKQYHLLSVEDQRRLEEFPLIFSDSIQKIESEILLVGSKKVVKLFLDWESMTHILDAKDEITVEVFIPLLNAMREDLGLEKSDFTVGEFDGAYFISRKKLKQYEKMRVSKKSSNEQTESFTQQQY